MNKDCQLIWEAYNSLKRIKLDNNIFEYNDYDQLGKEGYVIDDHKLSDGLYKFFDSTVNEVIEFTVEKGRIIWEDDSEYLNRTTFKKLNKKDQQTSRDLLDI